MKIQVGIHENVILSKALVNDKGRLTLFFRLKDEGEEKKSNPFADMNASEVIEKDGDTGLILWPFKTPDALNKDKSERSAQERGEMANNDVSRLKNQLQQILEQYMTKDKITWSVYDGSGMTKEGYYEEIISQTVLDVLYRNLCEQFIAMIQPYLDKNEFPMRLKLARQSSEKHFARLPDRYIRDNPFIEPMDIPEKLARVKWTPYELKEKLNDGTPISKERADDDGEPTPQGENIFGQR